MTIADEALPLDDQAMMHTFILLCTHENTLLGLSRHSDRCCSIVLQICNLCQNFFVRPPLVFKKYKQHSGDRLFGY